MKPRPLVGPVQRPGIRLCLATLVAAVAIGLCGRPRKPGKERKK